jgi:hypothetical protein
MKAWEIDIQDLDKAGLLIRCQYCDMQFSNFQNAVSHAQNVHNAPVWKMKVSELQDNSGGLKQ